MPQKIAIVLHAAPYGSERCLSALRIANMLAAHDAQPEVTVFLMSDATVLALAKTMAKAAKACKATCKC